MAAIQTGRYKGWKPIEPSKDKGQLRLDRTCKIKLVRKMRKRLSCPVCEGANAFIADNEFVDEEGFVCKHCDSNVFYEEVEPS